MQAMATPAEVGGPIDALHMYGRGAEGGSIATRPRRCSRVEWRETVQFIAVASLLVLCWRLLAAVGMDLTAGLLTAIALPPGRLPPTA